MSSVQKSTFSTSKLPHADRFEAWRESISSIFDVARDPLQDTKRFDARLDSFLIGDQLMLCRCRTVSQVFERSSLRTAMDGLDYYLIQTHLSGEQTAKRGAKTSRSKPGELLIIDLADTHFAETADFEHLTVVVPRPMLAPLLKNPDTQEGRVLSGENPLTRLAVSHLRTLGDVIHNVSDEGASSLIEPTLGLIASAINGTASSVEGGAGAVASSVLTRAKMLIEQNLHRPGLSAEAVCGLLRMSRASVYRLFEPYGGVRAYIQERRLRRAAADLSLARNSHRPVYDIAFYWGFSSEALFSRAFKKRFGATPRELRTRRKTEWPGQGAIPVGHIGDRDYEQWLGETLKG